MMPKLLFHVNPVPCCCCLFFLLYFVQLSVTEGEEIRKVIGDGKQQYGKQQKQYNLHKRRSKRQYRAEDYYEDDSVLKAFDNNAFAGIPILSPSDFTDVDGVDFERDTAKQIVQNNVKVHGAQKNAHDNLIPIVAASLMAVSVVVLIILIGVFIMRRRGGEEDEAEADGDASPDVEDGNGGVNSLDENVQYVQQQSDSLNNPRMMQQQEEGGGGGGGIPQRRNSNLPFVSNRATPSRGVFFECDN